MQTSFAAHGYGGFFTTALMDRHYRSNMNKEEAYKLMIECVKEVQKRLVINLPNFAITVVDKDLEISMGEATELTERVNMEDKGGEALRMIG